jgi:valyl-tRNA synthetase
MAALRPGCAARVYPVPLMERRVIGAGPEPYNPAEVEAKWQRRWEEVGANSAPLDAPARPFFNLMMFPYPSAEGLHIGNVFAFSGADIYGRYRRMCGDTVFEPMGFDSFGIHSENYALRIGEHPARQGKRSVDNFRRQLRRLGAQFDWAHEVVTSDPEYYRWTQWVFVTLFKAGLAEHREAAVNWCPSCLTVLADEQVINGHCERCDTVVEKRFLKQWFLKITKYTEQLLAALEELDWPEHTLTIQRSGAVRGPTSATTSRDASDATWWSSPPAPTRCSGPPSWSSAPTTRSFSTSPRRRDVTRSTTGCERCLSPGPSRTSPWASTSAARRSTR